MSLIEGFAFPFQIVLHPLDFWNIKLEEKKSTVCVATETIAQSSGTWKFKHKEFETCK